MAAWTWPGSRIARVVDGDTVDVVVSRDLGFEGRVTFPVRLRLNRINTPRLGSDAGRAAKARAGELLSQAADYHLVTVKPYKYGGPENSSGEYMAEIRLPDGQWLSDVLVAEGHAVYWDGQGPRPGDS